MLYFLENVKFHIIILFYVCFQSMIRKMNSNIRSDICIRFALVYHCKYCCQGFMDSKISHKCHALVMYSAVSEILHVYFLCSVLLKVRYNK